jgi:hypothetical protein
MQTQQTITKSPVHVKVAYENEFRRFLLSPITFEYLQTTLQTLFTLETEFRIKFQDDENDWVLLTTDQELVYATELSGSLLRLQVKLLSSETQKSAEPLSVPTEKGGRGRRGRGRGAGRAGFKSHEERLSMKSSRLTERINQLESKINSDKFSSERERVLRWRLTKLQEKLAFVQERKESFATSMDTNIPVTETPGSDVTPGCEDQEKPRCRGGRCGRGGRGGWRRAMMEDGVDRPDRRSCSRIAPEIIANIRQCKATLRAAREAGNAEEIQKATEAFRAAKATKWEAIAALRAQDATTQEASTQQANTQEVTTQEASIDEQTA